MTAPQAKRERRAYAAHAPKWQRFQTSVVLSSVKTSDATANVYGRQYSHVYAIRLSELKPRCFENIPEQTGVKLCQRVLDLEEEEPCVVVGTLIKEFGDDEQFQGSKCRPNDVLVLEDESGRVKLKTQDIHQYATGVVLAVQGIVKSNGWLHVEKVYPPANPKPPKILGELKSSSNGQDPHVLLISGMQCGDPSASSLQRDMLLAYLQGHLSTTAAKVARVIVAGGSTSSGSTKELDIFLAQICASGLPVDLLPGMHDPTTANWPQRPIHSSLVRETDSFGSVFCKTPNPYACGMGTKYILGTDGRNVTDLAQYLRIGDAPASELQALEKTLSWSHICPTGPDSVPTMPHADTDPMIITMMPDLYFAGNCSRFAQKSSGKTRLVCIPKFSITGEAVLVNLETMKCELLRFDDSY